MQGVDSLRAQVSFFMDCVLYQEKTHFRRSGAAWASKIILF